MSTFPANAWAGRCIPGACSARQAERKPADPEVLLRRLLGLVCIDEAARLTAPQLAIDATAIDELGMRPGFHDPALVEHHQPIHHGDGGEAVSDGDDRLALH